MCSVGRRIPREAQSLLKGWIKGKEECTEKDTREFITLVQTTLLQKGMDLDHGARLIGGSVIQITDGSDVAPSGNETEDTDEDSRRSMQSTCIRKATPRGN